MKQASEKNLAITGIRMATATRKCAGCKERFRVETMIQTPNKQWFHSHDCVATTLSRKFEKQRESRKKKADLKVKKQHAQEKKVFRDNDKKLRMREAQKAFNAFIRKRDEKEPCISCGRHHQGQYHAGHYKTTKARPDIRFNEDNCHKQCSVCNNHLSGNIGEYTPNLINKIGRDRFDALTIESLADYTCEQLKSIELEYKTKFKALP